MRYDHSKHRRRMALIAIALVLSLALTTVFVLAETEGAEAADTSPFSSSPGGLVAFIAVLAGVVLGLAIQRRRSGDNKGVGRRIKKK